MKQIVILILALSLNVFAQTTPKKHHSQLKINCQECHICKSPTFENPCLKICPDITRKAEKVKRSLDEAPDIIVIDTLSAKYESVVFPHKLHAQMAEMNGGCASCHHHNPSGKILACSSCHHKDNKADLSKPKLKAAYHQLCINCHREWDARWQKQSNCTSCHQKKAGKESSAALAARINLAQKAHSRISIPKKFTYRVDFDEGPVVTFHHQAHARQYGVKCQECHKKESCQNCHGVHKRREVTHENCVSCHEKDIDDNCSLCHGAKEKPAFDHGKITGWALNKYHQKLACTACHKTKPYKKLNTRCTACHTNFRHGKFNHKVTGLILNETHSEFECELCHINRNFVKKPQCSECHDDYTFPKQKPGKLLLSR